VIFRNGSHEISFEVIKSHLLEDGPLECNFVFIIVNIYRILEFLLDYSLLTRTGTVTVFLLLNLQCRLNLAAVEQQHRNCLHFEFPWRQCRYVNVYGI
jgi:hypothetical protein